MAYRRPFNLNHLEIPASAVRPAAVYLLKPDAEVMTEDRVASLHVWPALMTREQLCSYLSMSRATIARTCTVQPIDLGVNLVRYRKDSIDEWLQGLPERDDRRIRAKARISPPTDVMLRDERIDALGRVAARARARQRTRKAGG